MRGVSLLAITVSTAAVVGTYLAYGNNLRPDVKSPEWQAVATKVSETAGPVLKRSLLFIAAGLATAFTAAFVTVCLAGIIYPKKDKKWDANAYKNFSTLEKVGRALVLVLTGGVVGVGLGQAMMKEASSALTLVGASAGGFMALGIHLLASEHS